MQPERSLCAGIGVMLLLAQAALAAGKLDEAFRELALRSMHWATGLERGKSHISATQTSLSQTRVIFFPVQPDGRYVLDQDPQPLAHVGVRFRPFYLEWPAEWFPIALELRPVANGYRRWRPRTPILLPIIDYSELGAGSSAKASVELNLTVGLPAAAAYRMHNIANACAVLQSSRRGELQQYLDSHAVQRSIGVDYDQPPVLFTARPFNVGEEMSASVLFYFRKGGIGQIVNSDPILVDIARGELRRAKFFIEPALPVPGEPRGDLPRVLRPNAAGTFENALSSLIAV